MYPVVEKFLRKHCNNSAPLLLALSGGPDSLSLFYCLLMHRQRHNISFHVAHVDHGWRKESICEARTLQDLAEKHQVPFHTTALATQSQKGNLEAFCREKRYEFFLDLHKTFQFEALLTGHHKDDQAETICKRIFEGSHWSHWKGLLPVSTQRGMKILRPLLTLSKKEIGDFFGDSHMCPFEDPTNRDLTFLRSRFRESIFPALNQQFGKKIENNFVYLGNEAQELIHYFDEKINPTLHSIQKGPWGIYINLQNSPLQNPVEVKYLLRKITEQNNFFLSREIIHQIVENCEHEKHPRTFIMGSQIIFVDRKRIFIENADCARYGQNLIQKIPVLSGCCTFGDWDVIIKEKKYFNNCKSTTWEQAWLGKIVHYLPKEENLFLSPLELAGKNHDFVKERCRKRKIPLFLFSRFPVIDCFSGFYSEFLTGDLGFELKDGEDCWEVVLSISHDPSHFFQFSREDRS